MLQAGLYIVSTPIGNMNDMSLRAISTLSQSHYIFSEDTRVTQKLLDKHNIKSELKTYNDHSDSNTRLYIQNLIDNGNVISLVSDAGTPLISDPGYKLVRDIQNYGYHVDIVPGCCSVIAALTLSGLPTDRFFFSGFLPKSTEGKKKMIGATRNLDATVIFFETATRLQNSIEVALEVLGDIDGAIVREITKIYQTCKRAKLSELLEYTKHSIIKGEIVLLFSCKHIDALVSRNDLINFITSLLEQNLSARDVTKIVYDQYRSYHKSDIYRMVQNIKNKI